MAKYKGMKYLRNRLATKRIRVKTRYKYYEMKNIIRDFQISTPPDLRSVQTVLGWCGKAVDNLADRIVFREFAEDNFDIGEIFAMNNPDTFFDSAILSALISSCCFVYISENEKGFPRLEIIDGGNATGIIDAGTGLLKEGYAVLERDDSDNPITEAYFTVGNIRVFQGGKFRDIPNNAPYPLLVPIIFRPDAVRPFGHSRISRSCIDIVNSAMRTVKRSEISAEFYSFPQKYVVGTDTDADPMDKWRASMSAMIEITRGEDGDKPTFGQFQQQSMSPHTEQLKMFAGLFAGETGLTLDDLGFVTENPSSAEAIKASHENLRLIARKAQRTFGTGFLNVGYLAACLRDDFPYERRQFYLTKPKWEPVFEPDAAALSSYGDGAIKINQAIPGYIDEDKMRDLAGF
ncbi:phage portal protein [Faecalimonas mobilis]